ncbi:MAG: hypothetical protein HZC42_10470 [Candidatus Eisenbacteria bacterium]|nr:hypothetical protein [Candidatus Eisenbacteria bacterium]
MEPSTAIGKLRGRAARAAAHAGLVAIGLACAAVVAAGASFPSARVGLELGTALPVAPYDFAAGWDAATGYGAFVSLGLSPDGELLVRVERDRFPLEPSRLLVSELGARQALGGRATLEALTFEARVRHAYGRVRAHAGICLGLVRRSGRRVTVSYPGYTIPYGEPDASVGARGFGVGATLDLPRLPDLTVEGRVLWFGGNEMVAPLRVGLVLP